MTAIMAHNGSLMEESHNGGRHNGSQWVLMEEGHNGKNPLGKDTSIMAEWKKSIMGFNGDIMGYNGDIMVHYGDKVHSEGKG